jgi:hypothetical protein
MYQLVALCLVCTTLLIQLGSISVWNDSGFAKCLGIPQMNNTETMNDQAMIWIDEVLKGQVYDMFSDPKESIVSSLMKLTNSWECIMEIAQEKLPLPTSNKSKKYIFFPPFLSLAN